MAANCKTTGLIPKYYVLKIKALKRIYVFLWSQSCYGKVRNSHLRIVHANTASNHNLHICIYNVKTEQNIFFVKYSTNLSNLLTFKLVWKWHNRCCYITVDSSTTALQNGACTYQCISKQMHFKTIFSHNSFMKSLEFYENYITLFYMEINKLFDNIILTQNHAWHITQSGWNNYLV